MPCVPQVPSLQLNILADGVLSHHRRDYEISREAGHFGFKQSSAERDPQDPGEPCLISMRILLYVYLRRRDWFPKLCLLPSRRTYRIRPSIMCMNIQSRQLPRRL